MYRRKPHRRKGKNMTDNDEAVREILRGTVSAWKDNDPDAFADLYAKDATVTLANGTYLRGRDEIRAYIAAGFAGPLRGTIGTEEPESIRLLGDDAAVVISQSGFLLPGETAPAADRSRRATWVLSRRSGAWKVEAYANCPSTN
jgi:uncharacterized protein (TIGR02246 family)